LDGALDTTFGTGGKVKTSLGVLDIANRLAISSGKVIAVGWSDNDIAIVQYTAAGALDTAFGAGGKVKTNLGVLSPRLDGVAIQNGKIIVSGCTDQASPKTTDALLVRYTAAGKLDTTFGTGGKVVTDWGGGDKYNAVLFKNSRIYVVGTSRTLTDVDRFIIARYLP
jgi:uncharacterized delta-60 repeat protein